MKKLFLAALLVGVMSISSVDSYAQRPYGRYYDGYGRPHQQQTIKRYGRVSDPDGYTNIRRGPSTKSPIIGRYNSGDYLYYVPQSNGWSKVYSGVRGNTFMGYMHTSRIRRVNPNSDWR